MSSASSFIGNIPQNYEQHLGPLLFEPFAEDLAARVPGHSKSVLELACGTGRVTRHLDKKLPASTSITASDLNDDMIRVARKIVFGPRIEWKRADAQALPFGSDLFDLVLCQFGVMFFPDKPGAFREVHRVLQKGGTFLFNTWNSIDHNPRAAVIQQVLRSELGDSAPDFFTAGPYSFFNKDLIGDWLREAGFANIKLEDVSKNAAVQNVDDLVTGFVDGSPLGMYLANLSTGMKNQVSIKLKEALQRQVDEFGTTMPMQAIVVSCMKP